MRLIKPTTLLLLMAITCGTGSPQGGRSGPSGGSGASPTPEQICTKKNCGPELAKCYGDPECKRKFLCGTQANGNLTKAFSCGKDARARAIVQCAADANCFNQKDECPTRLRLSNNKPIFPNLVKQMTPAYWYAVLTKSQKPDSYFSFGCNKLAVEGSNDTENGVGIAMSVCGNSKAGGGCTTDYYNFFGEGNQIGKTGTIKVHLKQGAFVVQPAKLYINVVAATNDFAVVSSCMATPKEVRDSDDYAVFARYKTYEEAKKKSGDAAQAEGALRYVLNAIGVDLNDFNQIDQSQCEN